MRIPVTVVRTELPGGEALDLYEALSAVRPDGDVFLFESLAGPAQDCRTATVGWGRLADLQIFADRVHLEAAGPLGVSLSAVITGVLGPRADEAWPVRDSTQVWAVLRALQQAFDLTTDLPADRFAFGFLATFAYESAWDMDELDPLRIERDVPRCTMSLFQHTAWYDLSAAAASHLAASGPHLPGHEGALPESARDDTVPAPRTPDAVRSHVGESQFIAWAEQCLEHIRVGDIYQIQIGHAIEVDSTLTPRQVYRRLRHRNPSPYMYLLPWAGRTVIGASPELFLRLEDDRVIMRPIAGTAARAADAAADRLRVAALREDPKEQAEHVMLVDLCRNDIGRVCVPGTLAVEDMMDVEPFAYVHHLVSTISARVSPGIDVWAVLCATFPAGTMTGAPKLRAMQIIDEIEGAGRGIYSGAVGLIDIRGQSTLALCIRTIIHRDGTYRTQASAGIVADSSPPAEWRETLAKMSAAYWALTGEELLR
ncbi:anthranilate synthase component I family protein [Nocardia sp. NPDC127579]|uniref:anthranilate synthase component I family protein n=1 Tax=Nocardia sp. NPDC127579 TaxID=3345402 RepID=UPI003632780F